MTEPESKASPRPWTSIYQNDGSSLIVHRYDDKPGFRIVGHVMSRQASMFEDAENAALIVEAVNAYDGLREKLRIVQSYGIKALSVLLEYGDSPAAMTQVLVLSGLSHEEVAEKVADYINKRKKP